MTDVVNGMLNGGPKDGLAVMLDGAKPDIFLYQHDLFAHDVKRDTPPDNIPTRKLHYRYVRMVDGIAHYTYEGTE